jgi:hypothetical protein
MQGSYGKHDAESIQRTRGACRTRLPLQTEIGNHKDIFVTVHHRRRYSSRNLVFILQTILLVSPGTAIGQSTTPNSHTADTQSDKPQEGGQAPATGGANTGGAHPAVLDAEKRPITAGGFVNTGPIIFQDIAAKAGLTSWTHTMGTPEKNFIIETNGSGVGLIDYDNDGWLDIYLVNGSTYEATSGKATPPHAALFHNNHDGTFTDVTATAHVANDRWGVGVAIADYDNDGWPDIYVSNFGKNRREVRRG